MNILITGCAGFIGFHLTKSLLFQGYKIVGIDNLNTYYNLKLKQKRISELEHKNFNFLKLDINQIEEVKGTFDLVINLAAQAGVRVPLKFEQHYLSTNIEGFEAVVNFCDHRDINNLIYASSSSVYDDQGVMPFCEEKTLLSPKSNYGKSKLENEKLAHKRACYKDNKINFVGLRFFSVYGPYGRPDMAYYLFTKLLCQNKPIELRNKGSMARDMTYIDDIISGINLTIEFMTKTNSSVKSELFNLGNDHPIYTIDLLSYLQNALSVSANIMHVKAEYESQVTHANLEKSNKILGYNPKISIEEGLNRFLDWYKFYKNEA